MPNPKRKFDFDDDEINLDEIENWRGEAELKYSHELLVMEQYRRCMKSGSQEMRKGYLETKQDKMGNIVSEKITPDTRKEFSECIATLKNILIGDITADKKAKLKIDKLYNDLKELAMKFVVMEEQAWKQIPYHLKLPGSAWTNRWEHFPGTLNYEYIYGEKYLQETVAIYREILEEIGLLLHRMGYFTAERLFVEEEDEKQEDSEDEEEDESINEAT